MKNPWDEFPSVYGIVKDDSDITANNADNILIAWPVILEFIKKFGPREKGTHLLEYGCGTGSFANKLYKLGFNITGVDTSEEMIKTAKSAFTNINFLAGDSSILVSQNKFSITTSVMTFQFVEDIEDTFKNITDALNPGGIFIFAVFNPAFIKECLRTQTFFGDFNSFERPQVGTFNLNGNKIPVFIKTAQEYNKMLEDLGFESLLESYPIFTEDFLRKYPISNLINESEYLILGYKKH
jgi:2-polyprenyl-3-methyl-5-hydroxy-6-metoxy-1,4-benzoquinol methylase